MMPAGTGANTLSGANASPLLKVMNVVWAQLISLVVLTAALLLYYYPVVHLEPVSSVGEFSFIKTKNAK